MSPLDIVLIVLISISLLMSVLSTILVFAWRHTTPEISDIRSQIQGISMDQAALVEKFTAFIQRSDARTARAGKKAKKNGLDPEDFVTETAPAAPTLTLAEQKNALRRTLVRR